MRNNDVPEMLFPVACLLLLAVGAALSLYSIILWPDSALAHFVFSTRS